VLAASAAARLDRETCHQDRLAIVPLVKVRLRWQVPVRVR